MVTTTQNADFATESGCAIDRATVPPSSVGAMTKVGRLASVMAISATNLARASR